MAKKNKRMGEEEPGEETDEGVAIAQTEPPRVSMLEDGVEITGEVLKRVREAMGLSIADLSDRTKISKTTLIALEDERYGDLPNARVYVRGFIRHLARELTLDPDRVQKSYLPRWERWFAEKALG